MKSKRIFYILCCLALSGMTETVWAQQNNTDDDKEKRINAKDYVLQRRFMPKGKPYDKNAKYWNLSVGGFAGINKFQGGGSVNPAINEFGIFAAKDLSTFHTARVSLMGGVNSLHGKFGLELDHIFKIQDYVAGWDKDRIFYVETVLGAGIYGVKPDGGKMKMAYGGHMGLILTKRISRNIEIYLEPRLNLYTDEIDGYEIPRGYDIGMQAFAGVRYRLDGYKMLKVPNLDYLDNYFYEAYAGVSGDFSDRTWSHLKMKTLAPTAGLAVGKWLYPIGIKGSIYGGWRYVPGPSLIGKSEEPYLGLRLEGMLNLNTFFSSKDTDPKWEFNITGGYQFGYLAHKCAGVYNDSYIINHGPTAAFQTIYFLRPDFGIFGQARWSQDAYKQGFQDGSVEDRFMKNIGLEFGIQYRRRYEEIKKKKSQGFMPYSFVSAQMGFNYPLHTAASSADEFVDEIGQQFGLTYGRRFHKFFGWRGKLEAGRYGFNFKNSAFPLTIGGDFMVDASALVAGYNETRFFNVIPFAGLLYTHNESADENNFGINGGVDLHFRVDEKWGVFAEGALRMYKGQITKSARLYRGKFTFVPNVSAGVTYSF